MMMQSKRFAFAFAVWAALQLAACGSDSPGAKKEVGSAVDGPSKIDLPGRLADGPKTKADGPQVKPDGALKPDTASATCIPPATPGQTGMGAGQNCLTCHTGNGTFKMTLGGTVYGTGSSGVSGATVRITDNGGKVTDLVTGSTGNFWTSDALTFPVKVLVSKCPDTVQMSSQAPAGACNSCHDSTKRIHLP